MVSKIRLTVRSRGQSREISVSSGETLRAALLLNELSPYRGSFTKLNCKGLGVCGSCKVLVFERGDWWPRRSCQIRCFQDMQIELE